MTNAPCNSDRWSTATVCGGRAASKAELRVMMSQTRYEVEFINRRYVHHSRNSGYDQLVERLGRPVPSLDQSRITSKWIPGRVAVWLARHSGVTHYGHDEFYLEWSAIRSMASRGRHTIYHVLYGDSDYRFMGAAARLLQSHVVATFHQPPGQLAQLLREVDHLRKLDRVVVVGSSQIAFFEPIVGRERISLVPHGINTSVFAPRANGTRGKHYPAHFMCLFVGMHLRDFDVLRKVIARMAIIEPTVRFVLVTAPDLVPDLQALPNCEIRTSVCEAELVELYQSANVLLLPLMDCTANNTVLEGLSCGTPVIVTDVGSIRDYVDESCGVLIPPNDPSAMADAVLDLLRDEERRRELAVGARQHALQYDWGTVAGSMRRVYEQVLDRVV